MKFIFDFWGIIPNVQEFILHLKGFIPKIREFILDFRGFILHLREFIPDSREYFLALGIYFPLWGFIPNSRKFILNLLGNLFSTLGVYYRLKFNLLYYFCYIKDRTSDLLDSGSDVRSWIAPHSESDVRSWMKQKYIILFKIIIQDWTSDTEWDAFWIGHDTYNKIAIAIKDLEFCWRLFSLFYFLKPLHRFCTHQKMVKIGRRKI